MRTFSPLSPANASLGVVEIFFIFDLFVTGYEGDGEDNSIISLVIPQAPL